MAGWWHWLLHGGPRKPGIKGKVPPPVADDREERRRMEERLLRQVGGRLGKFPARNLPLDTAARQKMARVVLQLWLRDPEN